MIFFIVLILPYAYLSLAFITKPSSTPQYQCAEQFPASPVLSLIFSSPQSYLGSDVPLKNTVLLGDWPAAWVNATYVTGLGRPTTLTSGRFCVFFIWPVSIKHHGNIGINMVSTLAIVITIGLRIGCHARNPQVEHRAGWQYLVPLIHLLTTVFSSPNIIDRHSFTLLTNYFKISPVLRDHRSRSRWSISMPISLANRSNRFSIARYPARVVGRIRLPITPISRRLFRMCLSRMA
jgi:hypothetical protein